MYTHMLTKYSVNTLTHEKGVKKLAFETAAIHFRSYFLFILELFNA